MLDVGWTGMVVLTMGYVVPPNPAISFTANCPPVAAVRLPPRSSEANSNYFFTNLAMGKKPPAEEDPKRDQYKTKADIVAFVKKSFADGAAAIQSKGETGLNETMDDPFAHQKVRVIDYAYGFIEHSGEHYGQLVVYYRLAGLVPPESRPKKS